MWLDGLLLPGPDPVVSDSLWDGALSSETVLPCACRLNTGLNTAFVYEWRLAITM